MTANRQSTEDRHSAIIPLSLGCLTRGARSRPPAAKRACAADNCAQERQTLDSFKPRYEISYVRLTPRSTRQDEIGPVVVEGHGTEFREKALAEQEFALGWANAGRHIPKLLVTKAYDFPSGEINML